MKAAFAVIATVMLFAGSAFAQGGAPSGRGAVTGDPAASSATPTCGYANHGYVDPAEPQRRRHLEFGRQG